MRSRHHTGGRLFPAALLAAGAWYALDYVGPLYRGGEMAPLAALAWFLLAAAGFAIAADLFALLGRFFDWLRACAPTGLKGTSGFVKRLREIRHDLVRRGWGPYWGTFKGDEIIADYASNALTLGPAGTKKGVGVLMPTALAIHESKTFVDFKGSGACCLARLLRERGEIVRTLNIGDQWTDILGESDTYNPLVVIADNFWRSGGLCDVSDDIHEMCLQLYPEPESRTGTDDNGYFRDGSRDFVGFAIQTCILIKGDDATLGDVAQLLNDRQSLLQHALWACGRLKQREDASS